MKNTVKDIKESYERLKQGKTKAQLKHLQAVCRIMYEASQTAKLN
jgi:hypothetical protein